MLKRALATEGASLARGAANLVADARKGRITMADEAAFEVGRNLALTPGDVVFRNELIELIQYAPSTARVHRRPLLIVPPCINKYYILDLQPDELVRPPRGRRRPHGVPGLLAQHPARARPPQLGRLPRATACSPRSSVVREVSGSRTVNTLGFCVGGTLLASALAVLAARRRPRVESATFLTTMLDFEDPGEIGVYISKDLLEAREAALMSARAACTAASSPARSRACAQRPGLELRRRQLPQGQDAAGVRPPVLERRLANLPGPMYATTSKHVSRNRLREPGALTMAGEPSTWARSRMPTYVLATRDDHIVPWSSAYRTTRLVGGDATFVLGACGHIAGVINPPATNRRNYWTNELLTDDADDWFDRAQSQPGSWWPHWTHGSRRTAARCSRRPGMRQRQYPPLEPAPGSYVRERA